MTKIPTLKKETDVTTDAARLIKISSDQLFNHLFRVSLQLRATPTDCFSVSAVNVIRQSKPARVITLASQMKAAPGLSYGALA